MRSFDNKKEIRTEKKRRLNLCEIEQVAAGAQITPFDIPVNLPLSVRQAVQIAKVFGNR